MRALLDMSTTAQIKDSLKLGSEVLQRIGRVGRLHKPQVEQAGFAVLKAPDIPSILVETAFISNPERKRSCATRRTASNSSMRSRRHPALLREEPAAGAPARLVSAIRSGPRCTSFALRLRCCCLHFAARLRWRKTSASFVA